MKILALKSQMLIMGFTVPEPPPRNLDDEALKPFNPERFEKF